ncbi:META domain-containing protein [Pantoea coffeiphila]|uniref:META domain-containing protein n=1 Tax=Pantoea coffeiphila TaxID=1465635 RepID=UPI0019613DB1|nr:META domain-containing protein [Pantoea coffeiphila]
MKKSILLMLAALVASGCSSDGNRLNEQQLLNQYFVLSAVDGKPVEQRAGIRPGISFAPGLRVSGVMCNRFFGQGQLEQGRLTVPQLATTRMRCHDGELNQWEQLLGQVLTAGASVTMQQQTLTLNGAGHTLVYRVEQSAEKN